MSSCSYKHNPKSCFPNAQFLVLRVYYHCYFYFICLENLCKESAYIHVSHTTPKHHTSATFGTANPQTFYIIVKNLSHIKFHKPSNNGSSNWKLSKKRLTWSSCYILQIAYFNKAVYFPIPILTYWGSGNFPTSHATMWFMTAGK